MDIWKSDESLEKEQFFKRFNTNNKKKSTPSEKD